VDLTTDVFKRVVNHFMLKLIQTFIRLQGVRKERGTRKNVLSDLGLKSLLFAVVYHLRANLATKLKVAHDSGLVFAASAGYLANLNVRVHVPSLTANESFVRLDVTGKLVDGAHAQSVANAIVHEPCSLLSHADSAVNFVRGNAVLAIHDLPHSHQPLTQTEWGIFEDRSGLRCELAAGMTRTTLPAVVLLKELDGLATATRTGNAIGPAPSYNVLAAIRRLREVDGRVLESL
jgi:hypothetical protein